MAQAWIWSIYSGTKDPFCLSCAVSDLGIDIRGFKMGGIRFEVLC